MKLLNIFILEKLSSFNAYIMVGLPGSGKSTWIKNNLSKDIEIINQDSIRVELGIMDNINDKKIGDKEQEKKVREINFERIDRCIKDRKDFVIDNTNIKVGLVQNYYDKLKRIGCNVQIIIINTPKEICKERRNKDIPEKIIDDMNLGIQKVMQKFKNNKDTKIIKDSY